ncbi:MAG: hypothetical protein PVH29_10370 [Candidatus Zixiibacteriota bacterium]|jgi:hypothetical protein
MKKVLLALAICAAVAFACQKDSAAETAGAETEADTARPVGLVMPEAGRAELLLKEAGIPFQPRNDLIREFPKGCVWHAVYASSEPEVILETYAFEDMDGAARFGAERNDQLTAMDVMQEFATVTNGPLLLVAYYDAGTDRADKAAALTTFVSAFAGEE